MKVRSWIERTMRSEDAGVAAGALLYPLSVVYGLGVRTRALLYRLGVLPSYSLPRKIVSVGNITAGGTGKTPVTIFLAEFFSRSGRKVAVLSRGYRRSSKGAAIVSDGRDIFLGPDEAGDEPYLMASRLKGVPVVVCADRVEGGRLLIEKFSPDVIILDDAYQHLRLRRDINIALIDSAEGFGPGYLLPRGVLREPVAALKRADIALVKGGVPDAAVSEALKRYSVPSMAFTYRPKALYGINTGEELPVSFLAGKKVVPVCGIANPRSFLETLAGLGALSESPLVFTDHHAYDEKDIAAIEKAATGALVITTEKDGCKLAGRMKGVKAYALRIEAGMDKEEFDAYLAPVLKGVW